MASILLDSVSFVVGDSVILDRVSLYLGDGELLGVVGPSGSGKTSLLRAIAGLAPVASGSIMIGGVDMTTTPTHERDIAMAFQDAVVYPHMTARKNVSYPLDVRNVDKSEVDLRVKAMGRALEIEKILDRWPRELSAGHQQLVQVARAIIRIPAVLLLDEPLARVDAGNRTRLRGELRSLQTGFGVTTVYVTNDITEVMAIADRLAVLNDGTIQQIGEPRAVYDRPANRFVADFVGETPMNFIPVRIETDARGAWLVTDGLRIRSWAPEVAAYRPRNAILGVRPEDIDIDPAGDVGATVLRSTRYGARSETELAIGPVRMWMRRRGPPPPGREMLRLRFVRWHVFTDDDGEAIAHAG